jgi:hypothetical protein
MIFAWLRRRAAQAALRDVCGFVDVDVRDGVVRSKPLSASDARAVEYRSANDQWRISILGVNAPARMLHPSANAIVDDKVRAALDVVLRHKPHEVETADGALVVTFVSTLPDRWNSFDSDVLALADAVRSLGAVASAAATSCPSCGVALRDRGGEAACSACRGKLITGDVARERIFDPRGIDPGALKDASVGRGLVARCPACAHAMAPVLLDDVVVDVCRGCGALWCDADEHARLMGGLA